MPPHHDHGGHGQAEHREDEQDLRGGGPGIFLFPVADVLAGDHRAAGGQRAHDLDHQGVERVNEAYARDSRLADGGNHQGVGQANGHTECLLGDEGQQQGPSVACGETAVGNGILWTSWFLLCALSVSLRSTGILLLSLTRHLPPAGGSLSRRGEPLERGVACGDCQGLSLWERWHRASDDGEG